VLGEQGQLLERIRDAFLARFGRPPELAARAPGRVNLIGEHTDYNDGLVLPCAIDRDTVVLAAPRGDRDVRVWSREQGEERTFTLDRLAREGAWVDYVKAPAWALAQRGHALPGLDLWVASEVPAGAGLSSSAALGVALARVFARAAGRKLSARELAEAAHEGESRFLGVGCGILDPFASALGRRDVALRIDCRDRTLEEVPFGAGRVALLVAHSGVTRAVASGSYGERVSECRAALAAARAAGIAPPDARSLRDLGPEQLPALERALAPTSLRRVRHVIRENQRVDAFRAAALAGDLGAAGALLTEGMASLREDYQVSAPELDRLCALGDATPGCHGSRLTGAGFGGCTLHLVEPAAADAVARAITAGFRESFGRTPPLWRVRPSDGASDLVIS
jgi:galactokinase